MYNLYYDELKEAIIEISPNGKKRILSDEFPSNPIFSPDGNYATYIAPLEWEVPGNLYLYNLKNGQKDKLITQDEDGNIPKYVIWLDNKNLIVIIGFGDGTISIGGNVFLYDIINSECKQITYYSGETQITKVELQDRILLLKGIKYVDEILNEFRDYESKLSLDELT